MTKSCITSIQLKKSLLIIYSFLVFIASACSPNSLDDFREQGESVSRSLTNELRKIHSREDLLKAAPKLKRLFNELVNIMIAAQEFRLHHPALELTESKKEMENLSDQLREELNRVYSIDSAREVIEKCQEEALLKLDAFERQLNKRKEMGPKKSYAGS